MTQDYIANLLGTWASELNTGSVLLRITLSVVLSAIIGCERSSKRHSAGLRTFIIISLASATAAITEMYLLNMGYASPRITAAIIIGSAIISGYSILFSSKSQIKGLTTSAGLWGCGIIGIAIGMGLSIFFKVDTITVTGAQKYTAWMVREASGIEEGDGLLTLSKAL